MFFTGILAGQPIISARSGVLVYLEGEVLIAGKPRDPARHEFRDIQEGKELRTGKGRAEILLGPDAFLRVDEDSSVKMISNDLTGPRAEILAGRAILELIKPLENKTIGLIVADATVLLSKRGIYRIDAPEKSLQVYSGQAAITRGGKTFAVESAWQARMLPGALDAKKFNVHMRDSFLLWAIGRSRYVGMTNCFSAAREIHKLDDTSCTWTYHSPYGVACLPSESYCGKFLGPLATLAGASEPR